MSVATLAARRSRRCRCATCATWTPIRPTSGCARSGRSSGTRAWRPGSSCPTTAARSWSGARTCSRSRPARCRTPRRSWAGATSARSSGRRTRRSIAPSRMRGGRIPIAPAGNRGRPPAGGRSTGRPGRARRLRAVRRLRPAAADRGHRPRARSARRGPRHPRPRQDLDGGGPRLAPLLRRGRRGAGGGHRGDPPSWSRCCSIPCAPDATGREADAISLLWAAGREVAPGLGRAGRAWTTPSSCSRAAPRRRPS